MLSKGSLEPETALLKELLPSTIWSFLQFKWDSLEAFCGNKAWNVSELIAFTSVPLRTSFLSIELVARPAPNSIRMSPLDLCVETTCYLNCILLHSWRLWNPVTLLIVETLWNWNSHCKVHSTCTMFSWKITCFLTCFLVVTLEPRLITYSMLGFTCGYVFLAVWSLAPEA